MASFDIKTLLRVMTERGASDLYLNPGKPPVAKVNLQLIPLGIKPLSAEEVFELIASTMSGQQLSLFETTRECNYGIEIVELGRFRISAYFHRSRPAAVFRRINDYVPSIEELNLPPILKELAMERRGLILVVGGTSTGKSTTLAAMVGYRNQRASGHIITIEDPIEYLHSHAGCIVSQREVGEDTESYEVALKNALRQAPDVIMIGEIRSREVMAYAITFAETGHLCLSTLHADDTSQAFDRILHFFPGEMREPLLLDLSLNLRAIIAQRLIRRADGQGVYPACEILINTPTVADLIRKGELHQLPEIMKRSRDQGMMTFDQSIYRLYREGKILYEDALANANSRSEMKLMIKLGDAKASQLFEQSKRFGLKEE